METSPFCRGSSRRFVDTEARFEHYPRRKLTTRASTVEAGFGTVFSGISRVGTGRGPPRRWSLHDTTPLRAPHQARSCSSS